MANREELSHEELNSVILDSQDVIGIAGDEFIMNDAEKSQKEHLN